MTETAVSHRPVRASSVADCARKAALAATVEPDRDWTDREGRILFRGRRIGSDYGDWLAANHGDENVLREVKVEWEFGVGHMDLFLVPTRTAIEVLSSKHATDEMRDRKLLQLTLYMEHYPDADNGCLVVLDPSDFSEDRWPVVKDTDTYRGLVERMHERIESLRAWRDTGTLPARVCRKPGEAFGHFCRHADTCFDGWEPPEPVSLLRDPEAIQLATMLAHAKDEERAARAVATDKEQARKELEERLAALDGVDGVEGDITIGPYTVRRTHVVRKPTLNVKKAEAAGVLNVELLAEYMKPGASYWTTTIGRADEAVAPDFGDEAPW